MRKLLLFAMIWICLPAWADVQLLGTEFRDPVVITDVSDAVVKNLNAAPNRDPNYDSGFRLMIDGTKYYIVGTMFMAKDKLNEVCTPTNEVLAYRCKEGQRFAKGCHLLFFDAQGKWVGFQTMNISEESPHYCNAMPAMGVANKAKNELLLTMQYFFIGGGGAKKVSELGADWFRMTTLFRVKVNNGKIEVEQDDSCLGNPNQIDTIAKARKQLQRCASAQK